jgi:hypothetical protein
MSSKRQWATHLHIKGSEKIVMDIPAWLSAMAAIATAGFTYWLVKSENDRARETFTWELIPKMDERFGSASMREKRKRAAQALRFKRNLEDAEDVWDFFDTLGYMVRRGAIDKEMVWHTFFYWIDGYWSASSEYIAAEQEKTPTVWEDFRMLHELTLALEKKRLAEKNRAYVPITPEEFLEEEMSVS